MNNKDIITKFYTAFQNKEAETMLSCYHPDIIFTDAVFGTLHEVRARGMWKMLCEAGKDLEISFSNVESEDNTGSAHWEAHYTFSQTGRKVHNKIDAKFKFKDGLIIEHNDVFNLRKWAGQALGFKGKILGGTSFFKKKLRAQTNKKLDRYILDNNIK